MEYCAKSEKHPPWRIGDAQGVNAPFVRHPLSTEAAEKTHAKTQSRKEKRDYFLGSPKLNPAGAGL